MILIETLIFIGQLCFAFLSVALDLFEKFNSYPLLHFNVKSKELAVEDEIRSDQRRANPPNFI